MVDYNEFEEAAKKLHRDLFTFIEERVSESKNPDDFPSVLVHVLTKLWLNIILNYSKEGNSKFLICAFINDIIENAVNGFNKNEEEMDPRLKKTAIKFLNEIDENLAILRSKLKALN